MNVSFRTFQPAFGSAQDKRNIAQNVLRNNALMGYSAVTPDFNTLEGLTQEKEELFRMIDRFRATAARCAVEGEQAEKDAQECLDAIRTLIGPQFDKLQVQQQGHVIRRDGSRIDGRPVRECRLDAEGHTNHVGWKSYPIHSPEEC